jgi:hypothetical protein
MVYARFGSSMFAYCSRDVCTFFTLDRFRFFDAGFSLQ